MSDQKSSWCELLPLSHVWAFVGLFGSYLMWRLSWQLERNIEIDTKYKELAYELALREVNSNGREDDAE